MNTYSPAHVANAFLMKAHNEGVLDVDPLKIQKLIYNLNGFYLAIHGSSVVGDRFEAWPYGPVLASIYHQFKNYGKSRISGWALDVTADGQAAFRPNDADRDFYSALEAVWDRYKGLSGLQLSALTHAEGTPWSNARRRSDTYLNEQEIKEEFLNLLSKAL